MEFLQLNIIDKYSRNVILFASTLSFGNLVLAARMACF